MLWRGLYILTDWEKCGIAVLKFNHIRRVDLIWLLQLSLLWNTVYLGKDIEYLKNRDELIDENLIKYLSPLGWEHIHLTGDYVWQQNKLPAKGKFRPL